MIPNPRKMTTRLIDVDDASLLISCHGPWGRGNKYFVKTQWGSPWYNALHALFGSGSFTFNFTGKLGFNVITVYTAVSFD